eukprot:CAMPEP_0117673864 /NCGR_PEP_ID=MMETSP0804-20121206/14714_1 /TAXON_ID=1074897 /ORGANISM="Tetraselmis astigmatica, Strain CCMP880" /LENGTH=61 /DNA_ID=CAMNT_0005482659 /DNA_START=587 /DNA_END=772 /DNA_ORIENTATION=-
MHLTSQQPVKTQPAIGLEAALSHRDWVRQETEDVQPWLRSRAIPLLHTTVWPQSAVAMLVF